MARRIIHDDGTVTVELSADEMCSLFDITKDQLRSWASTLDPQHNDLGEVAYRYDAREQMRKIRHRIMVLRSGVTLQQLGQIEKSGDKILQGYAAFAQDAPPAISAIVWRTYAIVVYTQIHLNKALNAEELALVANGHLDDVDARTGEIRPSAELADQHLRLLQSVGALKYTPEGWEHIGLPVCMRGQSEMRPEESMPQTV